MQDDDFRLTSCGTRIWDMPKEEIDIFNDVVKYFIDAYKKDSQDNG